MDQQSEVTMAETAPEQPSTPQHVTSRFAKTLVFWPLEDQHPEESSAMAWIILASWLFLGIAASLQNVYFGLGMVIAGIYGGAAARYLMVKWRA